MEATTKQLVYGMVDRELTAHGNFSSCDRHWLTSQIIRRPGVTKKNLPSIITQLAEDLYE
jgi:hypothetical protein